MLPDQHPRPGEACVTLGYVIDHSNCPMLVDTGVGVGHPEFASLFDPVHHPIDAAVAGVG